MVKTMLLGGVLGGLVLFVWSSISWVVLHWHEPTLRKFTNEEAVSAAILANAPESGIYILPNAFHGTDGMTPEQKAAAQEAAMQKKEEGPFFFANVLREGTPGMGPQMLQALIVNIIAAATVAWLLMTTPLRSFSSKVRFVVMMALLGFLVGKLPFGIWWHFSTDFILLELLDLLIGWGLAGCVLAWATGRNSAGGASAT